MLAEVIRKAIKDAGWHHGYTYFKLCSQPAADHIAAAVAAHLLSEAEVEWAARAAWRYEGGPAWETCGDNYRALYRAAIAAILGDAPGGRAQEGGENG